MAQDPGDGSRAGETAEDPKERYGREWSEREAQRRRDRERRREEPDYGGPLGL